MNKEQLYQTLNETISFYSDDPEKLRGVGSDGECKYFCDDSGNRCAIGRLMTVDEAKKAQREGESQGVSFLYNTKILPEALMEYPSWFLSHLQVLHDSNDYWNSDGLSEEGEAARDRIINNIEE